ncbi:hypothetical protein HK098_005744 [Nowakowskiella sp. JEL0407]|nr:hypothetical protein HK098_005744 [Nowakowskiella sp. JEL0407]
MKTFAITLFVATFLLFATLAVAYPPDSPYTACNYACSTAYTNAKNACKAKSGSKCPSISGGTKCIEDLCNADVKCYADCKSQFDKPDTYYSADFARVCADFIDFPQCTDSNTKYQVGTDGIHYGSEKGRACISPDDFHKVHGYAW